MKRHALLILAHRSPKLLARLVERLDPHFEILIHLDPTADRNSFVSVISGALILSESYRIRWGSFAMVQATLALIRYGIERTNCSTFTLISGDSYPIKSPENVIDLLDGSHDFIDMQAPALGSATQRRIERIFLPDTQIGELRPGTPLHERYLDEGLASAIELAEKARKNRATFLANYRFLKGSQWWSLRRSTIERILSMIARDSVFVEAFQFSAVPDEAFFQTAVGSLGLSSQEVKPSIVLSRWDTQPAPHTFTITEEINWIRSREFAFARKFSESSMELLDLIEADLWHD